MTRPEQAEATRRSLVEAARRLFVERGYANTPTEAIVAAAGVGTRGALYHHFADKEALYRAVFEAVQTDLVHDVQARLTSGGDPLDTLRASLLAFLDCVHERPDAQALLRDGPIALGWEGFRAIETRYGVPGIQVGLDQAIADGLIARQPTAPLARLLLAIVDEAALAIATAAEDDATERAQMAVALTNLIDGLRTSTSDRA